VCIVAIGDTACRSDSRKSGRRCCGPCSRSREPGPTCGLGAGAPAQEDPATKAGPGGQLHEHHRYLLGRLLGHLGYLEDKPESSASGSDIGGRVGAGFSVGAVGPHPCINRITIENVLAEIGVDMTVFPDEHHLASWCGMCPGNEESAGRRLRSRMRKGNRWLRRALVEAAWAASRVKKSYLRAQFPSFGPRRGKKRALVAVAHSLLVIIYHILKYTWSIATWDRTTLIGWSRSVAALSGQAPAKSRYDVTLSPRNPDDRAA